MNLYIDSACCDKEREERKKELHVVAIKSVPIGAKFMTQTNGAIYTRVRSTDDKCYGVTTAHTLVCFRTGHEVMLVDAPAYKRQRYDTATRKGAIAYIEAACCKKERARRQNLVFATAYGGTVKSLKPGEKFKSNGEEYMKVNARSVKYLSGEAEYGVGANGYVLVFNPFKKVVALNQPLDYPVDKLHCKHGYTITTQRAEEGYHIYCPLKTTPYYSTLEAAIAAWRTLCD